MANLIFDVSCLLSLKMYKISTTLDWVHGLQPDDLEKFLAEKKDQRMRVLCLDLEPTGIPQQVCVSVCLCVLCVLCG